MRSMRHADRGDLGLKPWLPPVLLGFLAASFQCYLVREFGAEFFGNELTFGLVLGCWLLWGGIGSLLRPGRDRAVTAAALAGLYGLSLVLFAAALAALRFSHQLLGLRPGEMTGLLPALGVAFLLGLLLNFPLGLGFVLNARFLGGDAAGVYILESAGAAAAGLAVNFALVPALSNWRGAAVVIAVAAIIILAGMKPGRRRPAVAAALVLAAGLAALDLPSQKAALAPLGLVASDDTRYGRLQVVRTGDQITVYDNGLPMFSHPDPGAAEEAVHFALLQRERPSRALLVGGWAGGGLAEALKYPALRVDCVELDPAVIRLARAWLAGPDREALEDPRARLFVRDGRAFIARTSETYDAIMLHLPAPATAQINRYYTREFFLEVRERLTPDGVFSFVVPAAENYISEALAQFLGSLAATLRGAFPTVRVLPGANCVFLASAGPLTTDPAALDAAVERQGLKLRFLGPGQLPARLDPDRVERLARRMAGPGFRINRDLVPVSYYFHALLWAGQFRGLEARVLRTAAKAAPGWIMDVPLALFALGLAALAVFRGRSPARYLVPVGVMGFTTMALELAVFIAFQARFGFVYGRVPLLLALFMAGLVLGAWAARSRRDPGAFELIAVQGAFAGLLFLALGIIPGSGGQAGPYGVLIGSGTLGGYLFVVSNRGLRRDGSRPGLAYGIDLIASFAGVILASALIIPLYGIPALLLRLALLNAVVFIFLFLSPRY